MPDDSKLPLRLFGLKDLPAVPVDVKGMVETLLKLDVRNKETMQALQSLTRVLTVGGMTARAHGFLYGGEPLDGEASRARAHLQQSLAGDAVKALAVLSDQVLAEGEELLGVKQDGSGGLTALSLDQPEQFSLSWTLFPDNYHPAQADLERWRETVDVATPERATEEFWPTIARYGLAYNLILPKKVGAGDVASLQALFGERWSPALAAAAAAGLLYVIDLRIYEALKPQTVKGFTRFTPSTVTVLVQDAATRALTPELIRVAGHGGAGAQLFARGQATAAAWVYALQAAKTSITVYGIWFGHVYHWHVVTAAMQMCMFKTLSTQHPVRVLLDPQSKYLIPFDDVLLVLWRFIAPPTSVSSARQFLELANRYAGGRQFFDDDPTTTLAQLGIRAEDFTVREPWDQYPIVGQLLSVWEATGTYVGVYVDQRYPTDAAVQADEALGRWIAACGDEHGGNVRGLPAMDSKAALKAVLHSLVYRVTVHGTSRLNRTANPALTFVANFPPCLQDATIPEPTANFDTPTLLRYLPKTGTIGEMLTFYAIFSFSVPYEPFVPLAGVDTNLYLGDPTSNAALVELRRFVSQFIETFEPETPQIYQWPLNIET